MFRASQIATATCSPTAASAARAEVAAPKDPAATSTTIDELRRPDMANVPCPDQRDRRVGLTRTRLGGGWWVVGSGWLVVSGWSALGLGAWAKRLSSGGWDGLHLDQLSALDRHAQRMDVVGPRALRLVHQLVGALEELLRQLSRDRATLGDIAQQQADDPHVDANGFLGQPRVVRLPVVALNRLAEAFGDDPRRAAVVEVGDEEAEFVAPEPRVQILARAHVHGFLGDQVVGAHLLAQQPRDAIDNLVARRMPERVVVPLERVDIDQADGAPAAALLEREKRLDLLDEAAEVHQPRLRIAVHAVGEIGDEVFEVAADAADGGVASGELVAEAVEAVAEAGGDGLDGLLLRLLPETLVLHEHAVDGVEQCLLMPGGQMHPVTDPLMEIRSGFRRVAGVDVEAFAYSHRERPAAVTTSASKDVPS